MQPKLLDPPKTITYLVGSSVVAIVGGSLYGLLAPELPTAELRIAAVVVAAAGIGFLSMVTIQGGKVRSRPLAISFSLILAVLAIYSMWIVFEGNRVKSSRVPNPWNLLLAHPGLLWRLIVAANEGGTVKWHGEIIRGTELAFAWVFESGTILAAAVLGSLIKVGPGGDFCKQCGAKCEAASNLPRFATDREKELVASIENRDYSALVSHEPPRNEDAPELRLRLVSCTRCQKTNVLTVSRIAWVRTNTGSRVQIDPLIKGALLHPEEAQRIKKACEAVITERKRKLEGDTSVEQTV